MTDSAAAANEEWTVQRILQWTTDFLKQKGVESPRREAELLLAHARKCARIKLYTEFEVVLTDDERTSMRGFVKRRAQREPLAYITGKREFYGRDFAVGAGVLVPRPETETLVDVCLEFIGKELPTRVCEVGFGSGCIAVTLAKQRPNVNVVATDLSAAAMEFASRNVNDHHVAKQVSLLGGDGFEPAVTAASELFDGIVSNPPYIRDDELAGLAPEVAQHEPHEALVSGADGLDLIRRLVADAPAMLVPGGWIAMEVDPAQCNAVSDLYKAAGFGEVRIRKDLGGDDRIVSAKLMAKSSG
ncbi:MAG: peptide chain release factor N(5)-glutamine methyltransferase [Fuerstiella sp.]